MQDYQDLLDILAIPTHNSSGLKQVIELGRKLFKLEAIAIRDAWGHILATHGNLPDNCPNIALRDGALLALCPRPENSPIFQQFVQRIDEMVEFLTLENSFELERQHRVIANTLNDISLILTSQHDLETVFNKILEQIIRVIPYDAASVWLLEDGETRMIAGIGHEKFGAIEQKSQMRFRVEDDAILREIITTKNVVIIPDVYADPRWSLKEAQLWLKSWASAPIVLHGEVIGQFNLDHTQTGFYTDSQRGILESLSRQMSIAAQNAKLFETLQQNQAELQESLELKSRFMSTVLHEFRSPLASILANSQIIERYDKRLSDEQKAGYHAKIKAQIDYLNSQVEDVLLVSKAESVGFQFMVDSENLQEFCEDLINELNFLKPPNMTIAFERGGQCDGIAFDSKLLRHILFNLLSNAVKYSPAGGKVSLKLHCTEKQMRFIVSDEGIGIPEAEQAKLFQTFFRASNASKINGTGLGLTIVKRAVDTYGGSIKLKSKEGKGSRFEISLPRYKAARS